MTRTPTPTTTTTTTTPTTATTMSSLSFVRRKASLTAVLIWVCAFHLFVFGCADLFDDPSQCTTDRDCERFSGVCDVAHAVCIKSGTTTTDGGGGDTDGSPPVTGNDATTDEPAFDKCNVASKPTATVGVKIATAGQAEITGAVTLGCEKNWVLDALVFVRTGATLTIEPGTTIRAKKGVGAGLIVSTGGRIVADGKRDSPIVITSDANPPAASDWRGVYILGTAPPVGEPPYEDDVNLTWGGTEADDDSGSMSFVRIEYAAAGLVFAGVGKKTKLDSIQVRKSVDNCFFFNGGTVDAKHLVCQSPGDDQFEWGVAYKGRMQFLFGQKTAAPPTFNANGFLIDNAVPVIYNATICGDSPTPNGYGIVFRDNGTLDVNDVIVTNWFAGMDETGNVPTPGELRASIFFGNTAQANIAFAEDPAEADPDAPTFDDDNGFDEIGFFQGAGRANATTDPKLVACLDAKSPKPWPLTAITAGARTPPTDGFFDTTAKYIGAFKDQNDPWMKGAWVRFDDK